MIVDRSFAPPAWLMNTRTMRTTRVGGVVEDIGITRSDARNKMDSVRSAAVAFERDLGNWAVAKTGGESKLLRLPFGGIWLTPMTLKKTDQDFISGWNTWKSGYEKFYDNNYESSSFDPSTSASNDFHQAEKYEIQLGVWRSDLRDRGGFSTTPPAVTDKEVAATKPESTIPWGWLAFGAVLIGGAMVLGQAKGLIGVGAR